MKRLMIAGSVVATLAAGAGVVYYRQNGAKEPDKTGTGTHKTANAASLQKQTSQTPGASRQEAQIAGLAERVATLEADLAAMRMTLERPAVRQAPGNQDPVAERTHKSMDIETEISRLKDPHLPDDEKAAVWSHLKKAGLLDQAIAVFEKHSGEAPHDANAQCELATAYLQKVMTLSDPSEQGVLAMKADSALDRALAIDDHHWNARFTKAVTLSFYPSILGRQPEAIRHFETLLSQQEETSQRPEFLKTYFCLGGLLHQQGKEDKALEVWRRGLLHFPGNAELEAKIEAVGRH